MKQRCGKMLGFMLLIACLIYVATSSVPFEMPAEVLTIINELFSENNLSAKFDNLQNANEMLESMKTVASKDVGLTIVERTQLSMACKTLVDAGRASWRTISSIEQMDEAKAKVGEDKFKIIQQYKLQVEKELRDVCQDILGVLDKHLIPTATTAEFKVFYFKMKGDSYRYLAEIATGNDRTEAAENSRLAYQAATDIAVMELPVIHPIRLGLALNFSVFYYEILNSPARGCDLAKKAFDDAILELDTVSEESYKETTGVMQLIRDNIVLWTSDMEDNV